MKSKLPHLHVLVVDDDPVLGDLLASLLRVLGHTAETVNTGNDALLRLAAKPSPDAVLIDQRMPGMDGTMLAAAIATRPDPPRLIGMGGDEPTPEQTRLFSAYLQKPFSIVNLSALLGDTDHSSHNPKPPTIDLPDSDETPDACSILDLAIYARFATAMPPAQRHDLYTRTLDSIRQVAAVFDTASMKKRRELAHTLEGSCAMVGAVELAGLAKEMRRPPAESAHPGTSLESSVSYKLLRAASRLERMLGSLQ